MTVVTVILSNKKPVAYFSRQCNCLISLGGSKVKRENLSNIDKSMNHHPVAEGHQVFGMIADGCESHLFWLK